MKRTFEKALPTGYCEVMVVDAESAKFGIIMNVVALIVMAVIAAITACIVRPAGFLENFSFTRNIIFLIVLPLYLILHELTHGLAYKMLTGQKLKFGFTLTVAYCGIPDVYVYRKTAIIALLAPFVVFSVLFGAATVLFQNPWDQVYAGVLLGLHVGGCCGDLYDFLLYLFKFRSPDVLMQDTGPKQTFYVKEKG